VQLAIAAGDNPENADICPVIHEEALSPWVASRRSGTNIRVDQLDQAFERICRGRDCVVVEGAGGLLVPITRTVRYDSLFARWELELIIVAADKLGALNHTLLTVEAAQRADIKVRGIVLNQMYPPRPDDPGVGNALALRELLPEIPIVEFPCVEGIRGPRNLHAYGAPLDLQLLRQVAEPALAPLGIAVWGMNRGSQSQI
jgi:dethiobiotin synthetase